ncbi:MAG: Protein Smg [Legionellaceae bacterium]
MLEILLLLFQNFLENKSKISSTDDKKVKLELALPKELNLEKMQDFFDFIKTEEFVELSKSINNSKGIRCFNFEETLHLTSQARGFLHFIEQLGIINPFSRELIIEQAMDLDEREINLEKMQNLVLMLLFTQPEHKEALALMESYFIKSQPMLLH